MFFINRWRGFSNFVALYLVLAILFSPMMIFAESIPPSDVENSRGLISDFSNSGSGTSVDYNFSTDFGDSFSTGALDSPGSSAIAVAEAVGIDEPGVQTASSEADQDMAVDEPISPDPLPEPESPAGPETALSDNEGLTETEADVVATPVVEGNSYFATITPDGLVDGVDTGLLNTFTITFTELSYATKLGSAQVEIPAGFTPGTFAGISSVSGGKDWAGELSGLFVYLWALNEASYLAGGESVSATFTATAPTAGNRGIYEFATAAWTDATAGFDGVGSTVNNMATGYSNPSVIVGTGVGSAAELAAIGNDATSRDDYYVQTADIDLIGYSNWTPIGSDGVEDNRFRGAYSGNGYNISNLTIDRPLDHATTGRSGLFGQTSGATIKNVTLSNVEVLGNNYVGALVGRSTASTIENCHVISGSITGNGTRVGGLVGKNENLSSITNSSSAAKVEGRGLTDSGDEASGVGGLVGRNLNSSISGSYATGDVFHVLHLSSTGTGERYRVGGLVGNNMGTSSPAPGVKSSITNSYATGNITGQFNVGGLVGHNFFSDISTSYATGDVTGQERVGGLVGQGFHGTTIKESFATGAAFGAIRVGGLVGFMTSRSSPLQPSTIEDSYATGSVSGTDHVGGLVGRLEGTRTRVSMSYAAGLVSGATNTGGLIGSTAGTTQSFPNYREVIASSYDKETTSQPDNSASLNLTIKEITPLPTLQMRQIGSFTPVWSISAVDGTGTTWRIYDGYTYPLLSWPMQQNPIMAVKTYDGTDLIAAGDFDPAVNIPGVTVTGTFDNPNAGSNKPVTLIFNTSGSTLELSKKLQWYDFLSTGIINRATATILVNGYTGTYDGLAHGATLASATGVNSENLSASVTMGGETFTNVPGGTATWTFSNPNYVAQNGSVSIVINPKLLAITAESFSKLFGKVLLFTGTEFTASGLVSSDRVDSATITSAGSPAAAAVGIYPIFISDATGLGLDNYIITYIEGQLTVVPIIINPDPAPELDLSLPVVDEQSYLTDFPSDRALTIMTGAKAYIYPAFIINGSQSELFEANNAYYKQWQQYDSEKDRLSAELLALYETELAIAKTSLLAREVDLTAKSQHDNLIAVRESYQAAQVKLQVNRSQLSTGQAAAADLLLEVIAEVIW